MDISFLPIDGITLFDLAIALVLFVFACWGAHRGMILTLFSLVAVLVAFVGAILAANLLTPYTAQLIQPPLHSVVCSAVDSALPENAAELDTQSLLQALEQTQLPLGAEKYLDELRDELPDLSAEDLAADLTEALSEKLARSLCYILLFLISFILILILWYLLSRTLDLVARLPGLHFLNRLGGFVLGAFKGCVFLFVAVWLIRRLWSEGLPSDVIDQTRLLRWFFSTNPLELLAQL